jgi:ABC-2 type transport system permease protein
VGQNQQVISRADKPGFAFTLRQWRALFLIYVQDGLAYRAQGFIWILADAATAIVLPLVWLAAGKGETIQGFAPRDFVSYYLGMLFLSSFVICHFMWDISTEIREGIFSSQIVRPISFFQFTVVRNFAWRCIRTLIFAPLLGLLILSYSSQLAGATIYLGWQFWASLLLGHLVSVAFVTAMAMLALIVQEAQSIFELYYVPQMFLSGQLFPVNFLPQWAQQAAKYTPFYYTVGAPTEILVGRTTPEHAGTILLIQLAWFIGSILLFKVMFRIGMKHYTGVGM